MLVDNGCAATVLKVAGDQVRLHLDGDGGRCVWRSAECVRQGPDAAAAAAAGGGGGGDC